MKTTSQETITATWIFIAFWLAVFLAIMIAGQFYPSARPFRRRMMAAWKPALAMAVMYLLGTAAGGRGFLNPYALAVFCQVLIGMAVAGSIEGFHPLPVVNAFIEHRQILRQVLLLLLLSLLVVVPALLLGTIGLNIGVQLFGETDYTYETANIMPTNMVLTFFLFLSGSGIAEETTYRLVLLSFIWKLSGRKWLAIALSALVFGAYHLTPLSGMYRIFWQYPISQFTASTPIGLVWGYLFTRRGYGTNVLGHTFSNWLPMMLFGG